MASPKADNQFWTGTTDRRHTWFRRERTAWLAVFLYVVLLYSSLSLAFDIYVTIFDYYGRETVSLAMNSLYAIFGLFVLSGVLRFLRPAPSGYGAILLIALALAFSLSHLEVPAKRFHYLQYGPLTVLIFDALRFRLQGSGIYIWTMLLVALVGLGDECIQWLLPERHFGLLDVVINASAGLLALVFLGFVVRPSLYPLRQTNSSVPACNEN